MFELKMRGGQLVTALYVFSLRLWASLTRTHVAMVPNTTDVCAVSRALLGLFVFVAVFAYLFYWVGSLAMMTVIQQSAAHPGYWPAIGSILYYIGIGIAVLVCVVVVIALVATGMSLLKEILSERREEQIPQLRQAGFFRAAYLAFKDKYCPFIHVDFDDWRQYRVEAFPVPIAKVTAFFVALCAVLWVLSNIATASIKSAEIVWEGECTLVLGSFTGDGAIVKAPLECDGIGQQQMTFNAGDDFIIALLNGQAMSRTFSCTMNALENFRCKKG